MNSPATHSKLAQSSTDGEQHLERIQATLKQQLDSGLVYTANDTCDRVIEELTVLRELDKATERQRSSLAFRGGFAIAAAVLFFFLAIPTVGITLVVAIPALIYAIVQLSARAQLFNYDVADRFYLAPINALTKLKVDIPPGQPVDVKIDFNQYNQPKYELSSESGGMFSSIKRGKYEIMWFELSGCLMEGTKFRIRVSQNIKRKEKSKKKGTKITESLREKYNLMLIPAADRYSDLSAFPNALLLTKQNYGFFRGMVVPTPNAEVRDGRVIVQSMTDVVRVLRHGDTKSNPFADTFCDFPLDLFRLTFAALQSIKIGGKA